MESLTFLAKTTLALGQWWLFARMFYLNEMQRPEVERVGDHGTIQILAVIWPLWAFGIWVTFAIRVAVALIIGIYGYVMRVAYRLALLKHLYHRRKAARHVDSAHRTGRPAARPHAPHRTARPACGHCGQAGASLA